MPVSATKSCASRRASRRPRLVAATPARGILRRRTARCRACHRPSRHRTTGPAPLHRPALALASRLRHRQAPRPGLPGPRSSHRNRSDRWRRSTRTRLWRRPARGRISEPTAPARPRPRPRPGSQRPPRSKRKSAGAERTLGGRIRPSEEESAERSHPGQPGADGRAVRSTTQPAVRHWPPQPCRPGPSSGWPRLAATVRSAARPTRSSCPSSARPKARCRAGDAGAEEALARRHHACGDVAARRPSKAMFGARLQA